MPATACCVATSYARRRRGATVESIRTALRRATCLTVLAATAATAAPEPAGKPPATLFPSASDVATIANRVADWQLRHMRDYDTYIRTFVDDTKDPRGWVQGALLSGVAAWAERSGNEAYLDVLRHYGAAEGWQPGKRLYHADDHAVGQYYLRLYARDRDAAQIDPLIRRFDRILADPPATSLDFEAGDEAGSQGYGHGCQRRWCWCDALFMAPPVWFGLAAVTGDARYRDYADREYQATVATLFDEEVGLFYRDSRFIGQRDAAGRRIFWSRGNGWVFYGLASVIDALEGSPAMRARYVALYRRMAEALVPLQGDAGYWPVSLLSGDRYRAVETSGTGFFVAGLTWGLNAGIIEGRAYERAASRGWRALVAAVDDDGKLGHMQQIGDQPDQVRAEDTQLYGVGAFLLASTQLYERAERKRPASPACRE